MIAVINYGVGNLFSLGCSLDYIGAEYAITDDKNAVRAAEKIILPGVGAFGDAADALRARGLFEFLRAQAETGKPFLGICLGMQLLFEKSSEHGEHGGLGLIPGRVESLAPRLSGQGLKVPHMGWNNLNITRRHPLLKYTGERDFVYFVHSFYADQTKIPESAAAYAEYGSERVSAVVSRGNVCGTQFHPEKSGRVGLDMLRAFNEMRG